MPALVCLRVLFGFGLGLGLGCFLSATARAAEFDLVLRGGRVIDGTGAPAQFADVAIREGRIVFIGKKADPGREEVDAKGLIVAPGFIDVHTHAEEIEELPQAENFLRMGVTTLVLGNCGTSTLKVDDFFTRLRAHPVSANVGTLIGHGSVRSQVMGGSFMRPPEPHELEKMQALVRRAMEDGALGLSTGLIYLPGTFARTDEIVALARVVSGFDGLYVSHLRDEGRAMDAALSELFQIAREAGCRAQISHIKLSGPASWGRADAVLQAIEQARTDGLDITQDQYVYTASSTGLGQLIPEEWREGGRFKERLSEPGARARLAAAMKANLSRNGRTNYAYAVIASHPADPSLNGLNLVAAARRKRGADSLEDQIELIIDLQLNGGGTGIFHGMDDKDLQHFLQHPNTMIGSDSGVRKFKDGVPHPRGYGNAARVFARYVRELKLLRLEEAVRRMTSLPAGTFRLRDRGQLREGAWADVVVFDPRQVQDVATYAEPHQYATGFKLVLVNGTPTVRDDRHTGARSGHPLRRGMPD